MFNGAADWVAHAGRTLVGSIPKLTSHDTLAESACCTLLIAVVCLLPDSQLEATNMLEGDSYWKGKYAAE